jgi:hypothetical protein
VAHHVLHLLRFVVFANHVCTMSLANSLHRHPDVTCMAGILFFLVYLLLSCRPVLPELDFLIARMMQGIMGLLGGLVCVGDSQDDAGGVGELAEMFTAIAGMFGWVVVKIKSLGQWYKENYVGQFFKILLTYFQILGSFTMFTIEWPAIALTMIVYFKNIGKVADIFTLPNISCILAGYSDFDSTLKMYTLAPLVLIFMMSWPIILAASPLRGYKKQGHYRWRHTLDRVRLP